VVEVLVFGIERMVDLEVLNPQHSEAAVHRDIALDAEIVSDNNIPKEAPRGTIKSWGVAMPGKTLYAIAANTGFAVASTRDDARSGYGGARSAGGDHTGAASAVGAGSP